MGSAGSGSFGTYHVNGDSSLLKNTSGGGFGEIAYPESLEYIKLEDVAMSEYFLNNSSLPSEGDHVELLHEIYNGRLAVSSSSTGEIIGNLPTQYNYLINAFNQGKSYVGSVIASGLKPVPYVVVSLHV